MQIPPHRALLVRHFHKVPAEAAKYTRTEFGDKNPSWLLAEVSNNGRTGNGGAARTTVLAQSAAPDVLEQGPEGRLLRG